MVSRATGGLLLQSEPNSNPPVSNSAMPSRRRIESCAGKAPGFASRRFTVGSDTDEASSSQSRGSIDDRAAVASLKTISLAVVGDKAPFIRTVR